MLWAAGSVNSSWRQGSVRSLPVPWPSLARVIRPRGGQQVMVLSAPGVGKTSLIVNWAALSSALTLYVSADTDQKLMSTQLACLSTGHSRQTVEQRLEHSSVWRTQYAASVREAFPNVVMDFTSSPRIQDLAAKAEALTEVWGDAPQLMVLDTASDVQKRGEDWTAWQDTWLACREFARFFNCVVMLAHHVKSGPAAGGTTAPQQNDGEYKADKFAEIVIGLHNPAGNEMVATVQKNRGGKSRIPVRLEADHEYASIREPANTKGKEDGSDSNELGRYIRRGGSRSKAA